VLHYGNEQKRCESKNDVVAVGTRDSGVGAGDVEDGGGAFTTAEGDCCSSFGF